MPSTATLTTFYSFTPGTVISSSEVNNNFAVFRGHILPVDPTAASSPNMTYDLGADTHLWRGNYFQYGVMYQNTAGSVPASPSANHMAFYFKSDGKAYTKSPAGVETALGGGALVNTGTRAAPSTITTAGITYSTTGGSRQHWYIIGATTTGTDITANPQISAGSEDGQELILTGRNDSYPVLFEDGNGLALNGSWTAYANSTIYLRWDTSVWVEVTRNGL